MYVNDNILGFYYYKFRLKQVKKNMNYVAYRYIYKQNSKIARNWKRKK